MPYIPKKSRLPYNHCVDSLVTDLQNKPPGHLNYVISKMVWSLFSRKRSYTTACFLSGTLILVLFEFVRRILNPYEDEKIREHGDLYE